MGTTLFGELLKKHRQVLKLTLRDFCLKSKIDPGNYSRMERGLFPPPQREDLLEKYATALGLKRGSDDWVEFFDTAAACRGEVPRDLLTDDELIQKLPVLFRTLRGQPVPPEKLDELIERVRKG